MTIHVPLAEFRIRIDELLDAVRRGEEVVIEQAGTPAARLVAPAAEPVSRKRAAVFGIWKDAFAGYDTSIAALKADHQDPDERFRRKFGLPD